MEIHLTHLKIDQTVSRNGPSNSVNFCLNYQIYLVQEINCMQWIKIIDIFAYHYAILCFFLNEIRSIIASIASAW